MDIKNVEEMHGAYPELVEQIKASAMAEGAKAERERIQGIEAIENAIGNAELVKNAKYGENPLTAEQLALEAMKAQAAIGATVLKDLEEDTEESGTEEVEPTPANPEIEEGEDEDAKAKNILISAIPTNMKKEEK